MRSSKKQGKFTEAIPFARKFIELAKEEFGESNSIYAIGLNNLATAYEAQGRYEEAEPLYKRALIIYEKALGPDHPLTATSVGNLATLYLNQGRRAEAEPLYKRALAIREKALGPDHPSTSRSLNNLASLYEAQGRDEDAELLWKRALSIREKTLGPDHPDVALALNNLAWLYHETGDQILSLDYIRRTVSIKRTRATRSCSNDAGRLSEQKSNRGSFLFHTESALSYDAPGERSNLIAEAYESAQLAIATQAGTAITRMAARFATGDGELAVLVRKRQDAADRWLTLDKTLVGAMSQPPDKRDKAKEQNFRKTLKDLDQRIADIDAKLATTFPQYTNLTSKQPASLSNVQALLEPDEAMISYVSGSQFTTVFALRHDRVEAKVIKLGEEELEGAVGVLRRGLDLTGLSCLPSFDTTEAFAFYQKIFKPVEPLLEGVRHVFVVPDGALTGLPLGVLVTEYTEMLGSVTDSTTHRGMLGVQFKFVLPEIAEILALKSPRGVLVAGVLKNSSAEAAGLKLGDVIIAFDKREVLQARDFSRMVRETDVGKDVDVGIWRDGKEMELTARLGGLKSVVDYKDPSDYRKVSWLARKYAMSTLPSVSSLKALRTFAKRAKASRPFLGIGDPELDGEPGEARGVKLASLFTPRGVANVKAVRELTPLPESREELQSLARSLGPGDGSLLVGSDATETRVKAAPLSDFQVIAFATHGLVAGELAGVSEPSLVLTPPAEGTETDDGLLVGPR